MPPLPQGPPVVRADGRRAGDPAAPAGPGLASASTEDPSPEADPAVAWSDARRLAAGLVPADVSGALLIASVGELLDDIRALMQALDEAGVHSRFDLRYAAGLRRAMDTAKLEGRALSESGLVSKAPAALWWRSDAWLAQLPVGARGIPTGLVGRAMRVRAGWPGAPCTLGRARVAKTQLTTCRARGRVALFVGVRGAHLLIGGADDLAALRRAVVPPRKLLGSVAARVGLPEVEAPVELWARGFSGLWQGALRLGLRVQAGGVFVRGAARSETLLLADAPAPFVALESVPASLRLRASLGGEGKLATSLGVLAALDGICPGCKNPADRAALRALDESLGAEVAMLLRGFDPALFSPGVQERSRPPAVRALAGVEQLWLIRVRDPVAAARALEVLRDRFARRGLQIDPPGDGRVRGTDGREAHDQVAPPKTREGEWFHRIVRARGPGASSEAPLEIALGLSGNTLMLASTRELAGIGRRIARDEGRARGGRAFTLSLDPGELARAIDPERLPDPPTTLAGALLVHGLELARASKRPPPWRVEVWPTEGGLAFSLALPSPEP